MKPTAKKRIYPLFLFYLAILFWIILFKMGFSLQALERPRVINLVPFAESFYPGGRLHASEIVNNVLIFVPLGLYLTMLFRKTPVLLRILSAFGVSLLLEILQYVLAVGVSDVTDLMANTAGGAIGILAGGLLYRWSKSEERTDKSLGLLLLIGSIGFAALAALLLLAN